MSASSFVFIDLELGRDERFHGMAARREGQERVWVEVSFRTAHQQLVDWLRPGDVLVGHNLHRFDRPAIARRVANSPLLSLPTVDTLELSVLAFPARPYHRLTKNDRLVRDSRPNPLSDVRASQVVLTEALDALASLPSCDARLLRALLPRVELEPTARQGWQHLFARLDWRWTQQPLDLAAAWRGRVCLHTPLLRDPPRDLGLVMLSAWLRVAARNDGSVLPGWVRHTWPDTAARLRSLRATPCADPDCDWCRVKLSPEHWLHEVFGFEQFRPQPTAPGGGSLQRLLVERGLRGLSTFGILPTGGGKSLCFQIPAEARARLLGQLTVVISPLRSLMKDQVDSLRRRIPHARAITSGLPAVLRPQVMNEVRTGACGLLYLSPEQFRNAGILRMLGQRELGAIVFDEAHCLSQWGHDFRTDYPYVLKAVLRLVESQGQPMPPVFLFTATTQAEATQQILDHVAEHCGTEPVLYDGGSRRENVSLQVRAVPEAERLAAVTELLAEHLCDGTAIVFCGSRRRTESTAEGLSAAGYSAIAYHAGLDADKRRELQNAFIGGQHRIITATNAFGMGVDKPDVRLVVHLDMPSSLEAYLQEAGRAGRDGKPATAVLLWSPGDAESRFALGALGTLSFEDLEALWRAIRQLPAVCRQGIERRILTPRELLFQEALAGHFDAYDSAEETRVKAAVNWLELARVLERLENHTQVFSGRPVLPSLRAAEVRLAELDLPPARAAQWKTVLEVLYDRDDAGLSADTLAVLCGELSFEASREGGLRVLSILNQMCEHRLVSSGQTFTAFLSRGVLDSSRRRMQRWERWENALLHALSEQGLESSVQVHLPAIADHLSTPELRCTQEQVARLLGTWARANQGLSQEAGRVRFQRRRGPMGTLAIEVPLPSLVDWLRTRQAIAHRVLDELLACTDKTGRQVLVSSELERLVDAVQADLTLRPRLLSGNEAVRGAVGWLHDLRIITVGNGLAVFRSAMRLDRRMNGPNLRGTEASRAASVLRQYQAQKILRVHVMDAWAARMLDDPQSAERLRADWFALSLGEFVKRWFPGEKRRIARPTTPQSYERIVTGLRDPQQQKIVTRDLRRNHLVLAGPGSGKTRVLVHRVAWLLRCQRVRAARVLVVCYTRANALELRRRLGELVGRDARHVRIQTLHGLAMGIVGPHRLGEGGDLTLQSCIGVAAAMLRGEHLHDAEQVRRRDALLGGIQYLFIDEYQDIDADKYALLSAVAGRAMGGDQRKLRVFAVGDDDQAIYTFDKASTDFIRSFEKDYAAQRFVLTHTYRCFGAVIELAQDLVKGLPQRLKAGEVLCVDPARSQDHPAGPWAAAHPELRGRMLWYRSTSVRQAALQAMNGVRCWLDDGVDPRRFGVLARTRAHGLNRLRIAAEATGVPFTWPLPSDASVPVSRVREIVRVFDYLDGAEGTVSCSELLRFLDTLGTGAWAAALRAWLEPELGRRLHREHWRHDLFLWAALERRARTLGQGVHLGTMHSAKGLEFDHVVLLDDGTMNDTAEHRRLLYVALSRARRSLRIYSSHQPSPVFLALRHPLLVVSEGADLAADAPPEHSYGLVGRNALFIDWLGQHDATFPGHQALARARPGDRFTFQARAGGTEIVDAKGCAVARLSAKAQAHWAPLLDASLKLRLVAVVRERADDAWRSEDYRGRLRVEAWWTGVWEARWRTV